MDGREGRGDGRWCEGVYVFLWLQGEDGTAEGEDGVHSMEVHAVDGGYGIYGCHDGKMGCLRR